MNLTDMINRLDLNADWVGLREYKEHTTYHMVRDKNPLTNGSSIDHGIMVEVLKMDSLAILLHQILHLMGLTKLQKWLVVAL